MCSYLLSLLFIRILFLIHPFLYNFLKAICSNEQNNILRINHNYTHKSCVYMCV